MKKTLLALLACAGFVAVNNASAQTGYNDGDALLFFRASAGVGADKNVVINLGNLSLGNVTGQGYAPKVFNFGDNSSILSQTYGTSWFTRNDVSWGIIQSAGDLSATIGFRHGTTPEIANILTLVYINNDFLAVPTAGRQGGATQGTLVGGYAYSIYGTAYNGSIAMQDDDGFAFLGGRLSVGTVQYSNLDIFQINTHNDLNGDLVVSRPIRLAGSATVANNGTVTVVPEPSTYALMGLGALLLIMAYRRKNA